MALRVVQGDEGGHVSTLDVVAKVLREVAPRALRARQIVELAGDQLPTTSRTPATVVSRDLAIDVKARGGASRFLRVGRGEFVLKEALSSAFYNDNDAYAAAWTRNLIAAGEIAAGVVDERSIRDLQPSDVASFRQCHFFSGIGVWSRALRDAGWPDDVNVWSGSCPCQGWSSAGKRRGFSDDRHLWPEWFRLISACRPSLVVGEQVASKDGLAWLDAVLDDLEGADYACQAFDLPACSVGAPHRRQRLYLVAYARERTDEILNLPWLRDRAGDTRDSRAVAYTRERGREVFGATRLHDRGQCGDDPARRGAADLGVQSPVPDAAGARRGLSEDTGADRGASCSDAATLERRASWGLEPQRGRDADGSGGSLPDAERGLCDARGSLGTHGRPPFEPDGHGEVDGAAVEGDAVGGPSWCSASELGDTGLDGAGQHGRELPGDEAQHEEWSSQGDHAPVVAGAAHRPGDRVRIAGDPTWGGAVRGFWAQDVEWIYCRPTPGYEDGCFRAAESGTQPLVDWSTQELGRTRSARLRGFGNAIVLPLATTFVAAVIDSFVDALGALRARPELAVDTEAAAPQDPPRRWYEEQLEIAGTSGDVPPPGEVGR